MLRLSGFAELPNLRNDQTHTLPTPTHVRLAENTQERHSITANLAHDRLFPAPTGQMALFYSPASVHLIFHSLHLRILHLRGECKKLYPKIFFSVSLLI